jgi:hypothetical protein
MGHIETVSNESWNIVLDVQIWSDVRIRQPILFSEIKLTKLFMSGKQMDKGWKVLEAKHS